ncbi:hypothetical protein [Hyalangium rubrum]|uniref:Lipoprotein n=1 Tax=Hyalangium rubrum TaxID=3103134 RepID=A0ABU5HHJ9_9BACT|nr:hypothetical protein [Hyalangium sp. s54d21]MDY7232938.1 hypothetical protein [Hyalangium sp. s54d21]
MKAERLFLPTQNPPASLCWHEDSLIDWVSGGIASFLDGRTVDPHIRYAYRFDAAVMSPDGRYAVLYEKLGTKGLVLKQGKILREINRSFYHATTYEYPVALHTLPSGRTLLAHCPDEYCRLDLEDIETGERLTRRADSSVDIFHSRLQFSRDGRYLLSAGWVWHPIDVVSVFDVTRALEQPETLDRPEPLETGDWGSELHSAAFGDNGTLFLNSSDPFSDDASSLPQGQDSESLGVYSLTERRLLSLAPLQHPAGTLMAVGKYVLDFLGHPKLVDPSTGLVMERWPDLDTGRQGSSIIRHLPPQPPLALDPVGRRFAVGTEKGIEVVRFLTEA